jgi:hypothetical protein
MWNWARVKATNQSAVDVEYLRCSVRARWVNAAAKHATRVRRTAVSYLLGRRQLTDDLEAKGGHDDPRRARERGRGVGEQAQDDGREE